MPNPGARTETLDSSPRAREAVELASGQRLGRFVIERTLGTGGMGTVFAARDPDLDREVAIKVLHAGSDDRARQQRLLQEARAIARLRHPNVVVVHEVGEHERRLFVVMELIDGPSLREWLATAARALDDKLAVLLGAARGLAHAHAQGITHRDFKPENVMIDADGHARVVDFGLASLDAELQEGGLIGTPPYMAPEQLRGEPASPASDQFSWCITLYEAITGARPQRAGDVVEQSAEALPARVRAVLARGLAWRSADRFASMDELIATLVPRARPRWPIAIAGGVAIGAALAAGAFVSSREDAVDACEAGRARIATVANPATLVRLAANLGAASPRAIAALDHRAAVWRTSYASVCASAPGPLRTHRMTCLDDALVGMRAFVEFWGQRPADVDPQRAVAGANALADARACESAAVAAGAVPRSPFEDALMGRLQEASIARSANAFERTVAIAHSVAEAARVVQSDRVFAKARIISGDTLGFMLKLDDAQRELREAIDAAARGKEDLLAAHAWGTLIVHIGVHERRPKEALSLATAARAAVARLGGDREAELRLHLDLGRVMFAADDFADARGELEQAVALVDAPPRQSDKLVGEVHFELAATLMELGDNDAAVKHLERALEAQRRAYGEEHPAVAQTLQFLALDRSSRGDQTEALALLERARAVYAATLGRDHPMYASTLDDIATVLTRLDRFDEAVAAMREAVKLMAAAYGPAHPLASSSLARLGRFLRKNGRDADAIPILEEVVSGAEPAEMIEEHLELARAYVTANRLAEARAMLERAKRAGARSKFRTDIDAELNKLRSGATRR
jgi:tetratricopeptide (TPR) repeat protein